MLYYNYASENNYLFHKFQTFGLNVSVVNSTVIVVCSDRNLDVDCSHF